jgi:hypothetical protein
MGVKQVAREVDNSTNLWSYYSAFTPVFMEWYLINSEFGKREDYLSNVTKI